MNFGKLVAVLIISGSFGNSALAGNGFATGNDLVNDCSILDTQIGDRAVGGMCAGYIEGVADVGDCATPISGWTFNIPIGVSTGQLEKVVIKWLKENPDKLHHKGYQLVASALSYSFPCK